MSRLPEGWGRFPLMSLTTQISDGLHSTPTYVNDSEYFFINGNNLKENKIIITSQTKRISKTEFSLSKKNLTSNTILMSINGTIGNLAYYKGEQVVLGKSVAYITVKDTVNKDYIYNILSSQPVQSFFERELTGSTIKNLSLKTIKATPILLPNIFEQQKIAQILSTWDKAIANTEKLIINSQQQKKALIQQLLTGNKRFNQFTGLWSKFYLSEIANIIVSPVDKKSETNEIAVKLCNYTDVYNNNYITRKIQFMKATATPAEIKKYSLKIGDVLITKDSETPEDIAISALINEELNDIICGYHLAIVRPDKKFVDSMFLNFLFTLQSTRYHFYTLATGATRFGLSIGAINKAHFMLPPIDEQKKIAATLIISDKELTSLQNQLQNLKQEKKALMQQLLTGKRRVSFSKTAA